MPELWVCIYPQAQIKRKGEIMETEQSNIVKVQYLQNGELKPREYTYFATERLAVGDEITVPVRDTIGRAVVSAVDIPEAEIEAFRDKVKTIPAGVVVQDKKLNLCDTCTKRNDYPICTAPDVSFGDGVGHDNIIQCTNYAKGEAKPCSIPKNVLIQPEKEADESVTRADIFIEEYDKLAEESTYLNEPGVSETALVKVNPENDPQIVAFYNEALELKRYAEARVITTLEDMKPANDELNLIRKLKKLMEARRKEYLAPFREHVDEVNDAYKRIMAPVDIADKVTTDKMLSFNRAQERIRRAQEEINRLRMEAAQKDAALHNGEISEPVNLVEVIPEAPRHVSTEMGSTGMRDNWKYEIIDVNLIPREYMMPDTSMLNTTAKAHHDKKIVPGVRFYNEPILATGR